MHKGPLLGKRPGQRWRAVSVRREPRDVSRGPAETSKTGREAGARGQKQQEAGWREQVVGVCLPSLRLLMLFEAYRALPNKTSAQALPAHLGRVCVLCRGT